MADIYDTIDNIFDCPDITEPVKPGCYNICFKGENGIDETQFDLYPGETLAGLARLWEDFAKENGLQYDCVDGVSFAGPDEKMEKELLNIWQYGVVIIRDVNDTGVSRNKYVSPEDLQVIYRAMKACDGYNICYASPYANETAGFNFTDYVNVKEELDYIQNDNAGDDELTAVGNVLKVKGRRTA